MATDPHSPPSPRPDWLTRRAFVRTAAGALGAGVLLSCEADPTGVLSPPTAMAPGGKGGGKGGGGGGGGSNRNPLNIPGVHDFGTNGSATLRVAPAEVDVGGGQLSQVWAYSAPTVQGDKGQFPGPTLVAKQGDLVEVQLVNGLADETITHWHGMIVDTPNDGHPREAIPSGGTYPYSFRIHASQRATLNWYHPHPHEKTGQQVAMGLAGAFIIRDTHDNGEGGMGLPHGAYEVPLIIRDASFDRGGNMEYKPRSGGFIGKVPMVNGTLDPTLSVSPAVYRFRILNGCNARIFRFAFADGTPFHLIGNDGGFIPDAPVNLAEMFLSPAERVDVLVDLRGRGGDTLMLVDRDSGWDLLELTVNPTGSGNGGIPSSLPAVTPLSGPAIPTREFSFDGMSKINGQLYDMASDGFAVPAGVVERWRFTTNGNAPHPVHVHGAYFQVVDRIGGRGQLYPWEHGWKDTVLLEDGETVDVLIKFDSGYKGLYVMHCHKLEHEDMGMMANFTVVEPTP